MRPFWALSLPHLLLTLLIKLPLPASSAGLAGTLPGLSSNGSGLYHIYTKTTFYSKDRRWYSGFFVGHAVTDLGLEQRIELPEHEWEPAFSHHHVICDVTSLAFDVGADIAYWIWNNSIFRQKIGALGKAGAEPPVAIWSGPPPAQSLREGKGGGLGIFTASPALWIDARRRRLMWFGQVVRPFTWRTPFGELAGRQHRKSLHAIYSFPLDTPGGRIKQELLLDFAPFAPQGDRSSTRLQVGAPVQIKNGSFFFAGVIAIGSHQVGGLWRFDPRAEASSKVVSAAPQPRSGGGITGLTFDGKRLHICDALGFVYTVDLANSQVKEGFQISTPTPPTKVTKFSCSGLAYNQDTGMVYVSYKWSTGEAFISAYDAAHVAYGLVEHHLRWRGPVRGGGGAPNALNAERVLDSAMAIVPGASSVVRAQAQGCIDLLDRIADRCLTAAPGPREAAMTLKECQEACHADRSCIGIQHFGTECDRIQAPNCEFSTAYALSGHWRIQSRACFASPSEASLHRGGTFDAATAAGLVPGFGFLGLPWLIAAAAVGRAVQRGSR